VTSEFAERLVWTIEYIIHNPEKLSGITEIEQETPYGPWKMYSRSDDVIVEWLAYFVEPLKISDSIKMDSTPAEKNRQPE
jgi:hypothetical protein